MSQNKSDPDTTTPIEPVVDTPEIIDTPVITKSSEDGVHIPALLVSQLSTLLTTHLKAQQNAYRWRIGFRYALLTLFAVAIIWPLVRNSGSNTANQPHVALIKLEGIIEYGSPAAADPIMTALQAAFEDSATVAVVLQMNSPGGSPVQADMINAEIVRLRNKYNDKPIYSVVEEVCASGCYYVAAATDEIYANPASMVGSIGVIMDSFGAVDLMKKVGIERRVYTAGVNKSLLDPFSPATEKQRSIVDAMLKDVHEQFITAVKEGRGDSLIDDGEVFSGRVYSGSQGLKVGLIDGFSSVNNLARDVIGVDNLVDYSPKENLAERVAKRLGASIGFGFGSSLGASTIQSLSKMTLHSSLK